MRSRTPPSDDLARIIHVVHRPADDPARQRFDRSSTYHRGYAIVAIEPLAGRLVAPVRSLRASREGESSWILPRNGPARRPIDARCEYSGLAPRWPRYGTSAEQPVEVGNVFTLEPSVGCVPDRGYHAIEEVALVTETGCSFLTSRQTELPLLRGYGRSERA